MASGPSVVNRAAAVDRHFADVLERLDAEPVRPRLDRDAPIREGTLLTATTAVAIFEAMVSSRHLDFAARDLKSQGAGYYTIGSSGHEGNAVLGDLLRLDDWCFLHYRSGGLVLRRALKTPGETPLYDTCLSYCASSEDPISGDATRSGARSRSGSRRRPRRSPRSFPRRWAVPWASSGGGGSA